MTDDSIFVELTIDRKVNSAVVRYEGDNLILKLDEVTTKRLYTHLARVVLPDLKRYKKELKKK